MDTLAPVWDILVYVVLPMWVLAGFADYLATAPPTSSTPTGCKNRRCIG